MHTIVAHTDFQSPFRRMGNKGTHAPMTFVAHLHQALLQYQIQQLDETGCAFDTAIHHDVPTATLVTVPTAILCLQI